MPISRQKETRSRHYAQLLCRMTLRVLYSAQYTSCFWTVWSTIYAQPRWQIFGPIRLFEFPDQRCVSDTGICFWTQICVSGRKDAYPNTEICIRHRDAYPGTKMRIRTQVRVSGQLDSYPDTGMRIGHKNAHPAQRYVSGYSDAYLDTEMRIWTQRCVSGQRDAYPDTESVSGLDQHWWVRAGTREIFYVWPSRRPFGRLCRRQFVFLSLFKRPLASENALPLFTFFGAAQARPVHRLPASRGFLPLGGASKNGQLPGQATALSLARRRTCLTREFSYQITLIPSPVKRPSIQRNNTDHHLQWRDPVSREITLTTISSEETQHPEK